MAGGSRSKIKGSSFERDVSKMFEETFGGKFIRSANSGAFVGGLNAGRKAGLSQAQIAGQKADLIAPDHMPKLVIEAKAYGDFRFHQLLLPDPVTVLETWIGQMELTMDAGDLGLLCFKIDRRGTFVYAPGMDWVAGNHARYMHRGGGIVTDLKSFITANREAILARSAT